MSRFLTSAFAVLCMIFGVGHPATAADIEHERLAETGEFADVHLIAISGEIEAGDDDKFRRLSVLYDKAIVVLESEGGALIPAIEIGKLIRIKEYPTLVISGSTCTSACALIWVAGSKRFLAPTGRVGFHASYLDADGRLQETGVGNALVGRYLTLLNLPEKAIIFATAASPDRILWLTRSNMSESGIEFETFGESPHRPVNRSTGPVASSKKPSQSGWIHVSSGQRTHYYMDRDRIYRVGAFLAAWERADHSDDPKVAYYEGKNLHYYDCVNRKMAIKKAIEYDKSGKLLKSYDWADWELDWSPVVPDSIGETKLNFVCQGMR